MGPKYSDKFLELDVHIHKHGFANDTKANTYNTSVIRKTASKTQENYFDYKYYFPATAF